MFPLTGRSFPDSSERLAVSLRDALAKFLTFPNPASAVTASGIFPALDALQVNLNDAALSAASPPPPPRPAGSRQPGVRVAKLEVSGRPLRLPGGKVNLLLRAADVKLDFARDRDGEAILVPVEAGEGRFEFGISRGDLQPILSAAISDAAKRQGVTVQELQIDLASRGPRAVELEARIRAKKMGMSGTVSLHGRIDIDDRLVATVSGLSCTGQGMVGSVAAGLVQGKLREFEGRQIALNTFAPGELALRDVRLFADDGLRVTAEFGRGSAS